MSVSPLATEYGATFIHFLVMPDLELCSVPDSPQCLWLREMAETDGYFEEVRPGVFVKTEKGYAKFGPSKRKRRAMREEAASG